MSLLHYEDRNLRTLPGRLRMEVKGLKGNLTMVEQVIAHLAAFEGIQQVYPSHISGRTLIHYDQQHITIHSIARLIHEFEDQVLMNLETPEMKETIEETRIHPDLNVPLPLALTMAVLTVLASKQLIWGRSAFAASPVPFYLSGLVSVVSGYPFLKRGAARFTKDRIINSDLLLGTSALALALVRENIVVLAGLSLLQYLNWKKSQIGIEQKKTSYLSPEIQAYSEKASKWGMIAAAITWAVTRSPLRGLAVLLAANPRPATIPGEFAWSQAEYVANEKRYILPEYGSLAQLACTKRILLEDTSLMFTKKVHDLQWLSLTSEKDSDHVICLAASLMQGSMHAWKTEVWNKAQTTCRTIRTAFQVEEEANGIKGQVSNSKVIIGNLAYLEQNGIDCERYLLEDRRLRRKGFDVLFIAKQGVETRQCIGLLACQFEYHAVLNEELQNLGSNGCRIGLLQDSLKMGSSMLKQLDLDTSWLALSHEEIIKKISDMKEQGEEVLYVAEKQNVYSVSFETAKVPSITLKQISHLRETVKYAHKIDHTVNQQVKLTQGWNVIGSILGAIGVISAPAINLAADTLSFVFLSRSKKISQAEEYTPVDAMNALEMYQKEVAAADSEGSMSRETNSWHMCPMEWVLAHFQGNEQYGLSNDQVNLARRKFGLNQLEAKKRVSFFMSYLMQFKEFTTLILLGTSMMALLSGDIFDGIAMGSILLANSAIGTIQERKAEKVVETLNQFQPTFCNVIRNGHSLELSAIDLVPGDLVSLEAGDRIPADLRLIQSWSLQINESALTGESLPVEKQEGVVLADCPLAERNNMLYMGTDVCRGRGVGIVVQTGMNTEMGQLVALLKNEKKEVTPLQEKVTSISKTFVKGALIAGGLVFLAGLLRGIPVTQMITTSVTLAASAIPEGLPVTITIALSAGVFRMAKKNALIRKLSTLETLGRATVICTDKTGTLTKNEMTVKAIATNDRIWTVTGNGYEPVGTIAEMLPNEVAAASNALLSHSQNANIHEHPELQRLFQISVLCNNSKLKQQEGRWVIQGDPTEGALLTLAAKAEMWLHEMPEWHRGTEVPFDSTTGKMSVVCRDVHTANQDCFIFSKGSVEAIIRHCARYQMNGEIHTLMDEQKEIIMQQNEKLAGDALRVLGFAYRPLEDDEDENKLGADETNMIYVGMVGMIDPPKPEIQDSIQEAFELGVKPVMITGDHPITAVAIAKQLGIYDGSQRVLSGQELERMSEEELSQVIDEVSIFARVTPVHKLRIVTAFQKSGHIVAMTGDGVNDTPAIKQADVGIAMGQTGAEVTKRTAVMLLKEDHFGSIVEGVKEGRTIIGNIRKALGCLLTGNLSEILVTSVAVIIGLPIPFVPIQILLMNLLTDAMPAMVLAVNPGNKQKQTKRMDIVDKDLYQKVITKGVLLGAGSLGLFAASLAFGAPIAVAQSVAFATLVSGQLIQTFSWRQEGTEETVRDWSKDRFLLGALGISWLALLTVLYVPPVATFFHTVPLSFKYWIPILLVAGSVSILSKAVMSLITSKSTQDSVHPAIINHAV
jgi:Ca2+-transporting ATPase